MGLDQALIKMSADTAVMIAQWQDSGSEGRFPEVETETVWNGRKENHIHAAMEALTGVDIEDCAYTFVSKTVIEELVAKLRHVNMNHAMAGQELPTQPGFFFGGTDYDEWYFNDVQEELKDFEKILNEWDDDCCYAYWAWW
jgi:hypothetical protein